jgi:hypothetical protein
MQLKIRKQNFLGNCLPEILCRLLCTMQHDMISAAWEADEVSWEAWQLVTANCDEGDGLMFL